MFELFLLLLIIFLIWRHIKLSKIKKLDKDAVIEIDKIPQNMLDFYQRDLVEGFFEAYLTYVVAVASGKHEEHYIALTKEHYIWKQVLAAACTDKIRRLDGQPYGWRKRQVIMFSLAREAHKRTNNWADGL